MSKYVGTWVYDTTAGKGDTVKSLRLDIRDNSGVPFGTSVGLGWTPTLQVRLAGGTALVDTITGDWEDATNAAALFAIGDEVSAGVHTFVAPTTSLKPTLATDPPIDYEAMLVMKDAGLTHRAIMGVDDQAEWLAFTVKRWP